MNVVLPHEQWFNNANQKHRSNPLYQEAYEAYQTYRSLIEESDELELEKDFVDIATDALNDYKDLIDTLPFKKAFNAQTKFHSTVHEEFWCLLTCKIIERSSKDIPSEYLYLGPGNSLQGIFFHPESAQQFVSGKMGGVLKPKFKDRDFMLAFQCDLDMYANGDEVELQTDRKRTNVYIPLVTVECKQYIDKTMLDNALSAATKLKFFAPFSLDLVSIELNKLSDVNIAGSGMDGFYILRKQKLSEATFSKGEGPTDTPDIRKRKPICSDVVFELYNAIKSHIESDLWYPKEKDFLTKGSLKNKLF